MSPNISNNRRSFLQRSVAIGTTTLGGGLLGTGIAAFASEEISILQPDGAILSFVEGEMEDSEEPEESAHPFSDASILLDSDTGQFIHDDADD